jgi:hypothetical protein
MKIELFRFDAGFFYHSPCTIIAAAPQTVATAADKEQTITSARRASKEALRRGSIIYITFFMVRE